MKQEFKIKNILILFTIFTVVYMLVQNYMSPYFYRGQAHISKFLMDNTQKQKIAPQRLYINAWRLARNEYIDSSMNNQNWYRWRNKYLRHIKTEEDANIAINTMLYSLHDPFTKFLKAQNFIEQKIIMDSQITNIGIIFDRNGDDLIVGDVLKDSSAQDENILPNDKIISINNIPVKYLTPDNIKIIVEGSSKKDIKIVILRDNKPIKKVLRKKIIPIETMQYFITDNNIGIINMSNVMGEKALLDFKDIIKKTNNTNGLILDLRNNYGGMLTNAILMADYMSDNKRLISIISKGKLKYELYGDRDSIFKEKPVIVLVNSKTASAAEVLAGILKDNLGAIIIGEQTYGKNTIQQVIPMANSSGLIITSDKYILPNGDDINKVGITPDIKIKPKNGKDISLILAIKIINNIMKN